MDTIEQEVKKMEWTSGITWMIRPIVGMLLTWCAGLVSVWGVLEGLLEVGTLVCGFLIGILTVLKLLRDLKILRWPDHRTKVEDNSAQTTMATE